jgi:NAD(P)-dependent dehydrogenase (short-subunit alcohol dehydrogenase family)
MPCLPLAVQPPPSLVAAARSLAFDGGPQAPRCQSAGSTGHRAIHVAEHLGIFDAKPFEEIPDEDWQRFLDTNVTAGW